MQSEGFMDIVSNEENYRYKLGIIDILTKYTKMKAVENITKSVTAGVDQSEISAVDSETYAKRFVKFMDGHF
jgi:hypothetical protein